MVLSSTFGGVDAGVCFVFGLGFVVGWPVLFLVFDGISDTHLFASLARLVVGGTSNLDELGRKETLVPSQMNLIMWDQSVIFCKDYIRTILTLLNLAERPGFEVFVKVGNCSTNWYDR